MDISGSEELLPLTTDLDAVKSKINGVVASGLTYMPTGLMWGWRMLDRHQPFTESSSTPEDKTRNILVFLTDGYNTKSQSVDNMHNGDDRAAADALTATACTKIKEAEIEVFTITFEVIDNDARTLVRNCASDPTMYFDAASGSELTAAFGTIGRTILNPRLTH